MISLLHALYSAMWSNMWAPNVWTLIGIAAHFALSQVRHERRHADLKAHITEQLGSTRRADPAPVDPVPRPLARPVHQEQR